MEETQLTPRQEKQLQREQLIKSLLLNILSDHVGHDSRIPRNVLRHRLIALLGDKVGDRKMRDLLEELRKEERGCWIMGSRSAGYFIASDLEELEKFLSADRHLVARLSERIRAQERFAIRQTPDQHYRLKKPDQMPLLPITEGS